MTVRRRILRTYLVLILIVLGYLGISTYTRELRADVQEDRISILELEKQWAQVQITLSDIVINWDDRSAYQLLLRRREVFERRLAATRNQISNRPYYPEGFKRLFANLNEVWAMADEHLQRIEAEVESPQFEEVEARLRRQPGLQRLSTLWAELIDEDSPASNRLAHDVEQLIGEVEFFPIYADTVDSIFREILRTASQVRNRIILIERVLQVIFFAVFLVACVAFAFRFSHMLSEPIIRVASRLRAFMGQTGVEPVHNDDEVYVLSNTVRQLLRHYTELSERAAYLARGEISQSHLHFPREGIVGRSLDEIAAYLEDLAKTSDWIRSGEYGAQIRERSDNDVLAHNFNVMSTVIYEKITTLRSMFEAVDEAVFVVDETECVHETNSRFFRLFGITTSAELSEKQKLEQSIVIQLRETTSRVLEGDRVTDYYTNLSFRDCREVPVKITAQRLPEDERAVQRVMYLISNESWRARAKREQERLRAQATMAELKALRAQINPHFFFNTLNSIAYLIDSDPQQAIETLEKLSELFRYALISTKRDRVPLKEEIDHVGRFLDIERLRYGPLLNVKYAIDEESADVPVPPMLLQPIVENAVRYGGDSRSKVDVGIQASRMENYLTIEIGDRGDRKIDPDQLLKSSGTGLQNVNHRLKTLYSTQLEFSKRTPKGLSVRMWIPL